MVACAKTLGMARLMDLFTANCSLDFAEIERNQEILERISYVVLDYAWTVVTHLNAEKKFCLSEAYFNCFTE